MFLKCVVAQKIESWQLHPRIRSWMPLDFCLWQEIEERLSGMRILMKVKYVGKHKDSDPEGVTEIEGSYLRAVETCE